MANDPIKGPFEVFTDIDGQPLENGYIYVGTAGLDAKTNQISIYWDDTLTVAATQPIRTTGGYPSNSGTPGKLYIGNIDYSITVENKNASTVFSLSNARNVSEVSVKDFGAIGDGVANDATAIQNAVNAYSRVYFPPGRYNINSNITLNEGNYLYGDRSESIIDVNNVACTVALDCVNLFTKGATIEGLTVEGNLEAYCVQIFNSKHITVKECDLSLGDADCIYIDGDVEDIKVLNCRIDDANRNGISVIDGEDILIEGCEIVGTNATRSSPYSGIDVEPNPGDIVNNIKIVNNTVRNWGGHGIAFAGVTSGTQAVTNALCSSNNISKCDFDEILISGGGCETISVIGNTITSNNKGIASTNVGSSTPPRANISGNYIRAASGVSTVKGISIEVDSQFVVTGNSIVGIQQPISASSCTSGLTISGNIFSDYTTTVVLFSCNQINFTGNIFKVGFGLDIQTCSGVIAQGNSFYDMDVTATELINVRLTSSKVSVVDNLFSGTGAGLTTFVAQSASTNVNISGNQGVTQGGISQWQQSGSWTPTFLGTTGDPTVGYDGTVSAHWYRIGEIVYVSCFLMTDSISGGTGNVLVGGLPYNVENDECCNGGISISFSSDFTTNQPTAVRAIKNSKTLALYYRATANGAATDLPISDLQNAANKNILYLGGVYRTSDSV